MADDPKQQEPRGTEPQGGQEPPQEPKPDPAPDPEPQSDGDVKDSHGQPGINKERHDREVAELKAEIESLKADAADAAEQKSKREDYEKKVAELEAKLADSGVTHSLEMAGCRNVKAAKALLDDYDGDVAKLKSECPYLFETGKQVGSTGPKPGGAPSASEERRKKAREAAAGNLTIKR